MVLSQQLGSGVVIVIVDTEVDDELMMRRGELGGERVCSHVRGSGLWEQQVWELEVAA